MEKRHQTLQNGSVGWGGWVDAAGGGTARRRWASGVCSAVTRGLCAFAEFDASRPGAVRVPRDRLVRFAEFDAGN